MLKSAQDAVATAHRCLQRTASAVHRNKQHQHKVRCDPVALLRRLIVALLAVRRKVLRLQRFERVRLQQTCQERLPVGADERVCLSSRNVPLLGGRV